METKVADLADLTILNDLAERLAAITQEEVAGIERKMLLSLPAGLPAVGVVGNQTARRVFVLSAILMNQSGMESMHALMAHNPDVERAHTEQSALLKSLALVYKEIFWAQVKMDLAIHRPVNTTIGKGWVVAELAASAGGGYSISFQA